MKDNYKPIDFVIFDCDGVLVDSEKLAHEVFAELITEAGQPMEAHSLAQHYSGMVLVDILKDLEQKTKKVFSASMLQKADELFTKKMNASNLQMPAVQQTLKKMTKPYCVCSNGTSKNVIAELKTTDLYPYFEGKIFCAPELGTKRLKPCPDIYLYVAKTVNIAPENILVLEDSITGVTAAHKAGMRVVGFTGGSHYYPMHSDDLVQAGAVTTIKHFSDILPMITALEQWQVDY